MEIPPGGFQLKSGFGQSQPSADPELMLSMMSILSVFMEKAVENAAQYTRAAGRRVVSKKDMSMALKAEAVPSGRFWETPDLMRRVSEHRSELQTEEDDEEDEESSSEDQEEEEEVEEEWTAAVPEDAHEISELIVRLNGAEDEFEAWVPTTPLEVAVRNAIVSATEV